MMEKFSLKEEEIKKLGNRALFRVLLKE